MVSVLCVGVLVGVFLFVLIWSCVSVPEREKAKRNPARARRVVRKEKKSTRAKITEKRQQNTHDSTKNVETVENMDTKHLIDGTTIEQISR